MTALFFSLIGVIYGRTHTRDIREMGGLMRIMPFASVCYVIAGFASLGLPGFSGFVAEMTVFIGSFEHADLLRRVDLIERYREEVVPFEKARTETIRARILDNLSKLGVEVDRNRLEQEMIYYLEKLDITEEKVRLENHCRYFREVAAGEEAPGRKLGFIAQEMGREINTMGSKANESNIQILVVRMKDELEKIKEQVLNIL